VGSRSRISNPAFPPAPPPTAGFELEALIRKLVEDGEIELT
jgi:hypothetical protein